MPLILQEYKGSEVGRGPARYLPFAPSPTNMKHSEDGSSISPLQQAPPSSVEEEHGVKKPYSIYKTGEKYFIVGVVAFAGLHSPLTANVYFPAIPMIASAFHKPIELINLTVTAYMILQGLSPMFWGTMSDHWGRRPIFIACLLILSLSCVGLALVPTSDYWLLILLRCIQATGSASTLALGAGVIADISVAAERGGFFGIYGLGPFVGPAVGPVIGGALGFKLGWRSIFWFLCISSAVCLLFVVMFLPETLRSLVGDGSITPPTIYRPLLHIMGGDPPDPSSTQKASSMTHPNPLRLLTHPDVMVLLATHGITYAMFYSITATLSTLFLKTYPFLDERKIGFCFLSIGGGMVLGSVSSGKFLDWDYQRIKRRMTNDTAGADPEKNMAPRDKINEDNFPIEKARLRAMPVYVTALVACCIGYGWCLERKVSLAAPLTLLVAIGYVSIAVMNATLTLCIDLFPSQGSSVTACNNLVRCLLGAALISVMEPVISALGAGWTYVLFGGVCGLIIPLTYLVMKIGPACRAKRSSTNPTHVTT